MTPATWSTSATPGVRRALMLELVGLLDAVVEAREITWRRLNVYLDYCNDLACADGGSSEANPGVWHWIATHGVVTQADREAQR